jgi:RimJ/RimL family protein N-acetyltransferase
MAELITDRLLLRAWRKSDFEPYAALNQDPVVMEHFASLKAPVESRRQAERFDSELAARGFGLWALEIRATGQFIGFTGLSIPTFAAHFTPAVEIGWRIAKGAWGKGYATEAARAALDYGFGPADLDEVVSFTATTNLRSQRVMERLGMVHNPADDFDHPNFEAGHRLQRHAHYRLSRAHWSG